MISEVIFEDSLVGFVLQLKAEHLTPDNQSEIRER